MLKFFALAFYFYTMNLLEQFNNYWKKEFRHLSTSNCHLLLAVSGGLDSVVLTDLVSKAGFNFTIVHCNFQLRGAESERDEQFVQELAKKYNKEIFVQKFNTAEYAEQNKVSIQVAARELRYTWFSELINSKFKIQNSKVLTAHHADDNIETVLMNFFRGTGIKGLHGILPTQDYILRPLLFAKRIEIETYVKDNQLSWVEDSSNDSDKYSRNFFRHQIIPLVKKIFPNTEDNLLANIERWKEVEEIYNQSIAQTKAILIEQKGNEFYIPVLKLVKQKPLATIVYEIIKDFGFTALQVNDVVQLLQATNGKFVASLTHRIIRNRNWLIVAPVIATEAIHILIEKPNSSTQFIGGTLKVETLENISTIPDDVNLVQLDIAKIQFPLILRKWKVGDYFYPLGMEKKKKISRFLIDKKLSTTQKENIWLIESNNKIIWIVGQRIDNRFKVLPSTKAILQLSFTV
jgi:tRNA(Ile)-lysidine synthase